MGMHQANHFPIAHQAVAPHDVPRQIGQRVALAGGTDPEGELRDFHRLLRQIDAVQVVIEDQVGNGILQRGDLFGRHARAGQAMNDRLIVGIQGLVGADQERPRAAGRIADRNGLEDFQAGGPIGQQLLGVLVRAGLRIDLMLLLQPSKALQHQRVDGPFHDQTT